MRPQQSPPATAQSLRAAVSATSYGVAHVRANDVTGAGYGHGFALAASNLCTIADRWVTVRGERSRFFGIEGRWDAQQTVNNLQSDFYWRALIDPDFVGRLLRQPVPVGPIAEVRVLVRGYVAGYNQ